MDLHQDQQYLLNVDRKYPIVIEHAKGVYLYDQDRKYLDMFSGTGVNVLGHRHPAVISAIKEQIKKSLHLSNWIVNQPVVDLAKALVENTFPSKVFFANSGTEAVEAALKLSKKRGKQINPHKYHFLSFKRSYHGRTIGSLSLTGQPEKQEAYKPLMPGVSYVNRNDIEDLRQKANDNICAIFIELVQGNGGVNVVEQEFIDEIKVLAKKHDFLIVVDEVLTGLMRTGTLFAYTQYSLQPDIVLLAKSVGGGLPLGAMIVAKPHTKVFKYDDISTTFGGNPVSCAAGLASLEVLLDSDFQNAVVSKSKWFYQELETIKKQFPKTISDLRGLGMMLGLESKGAYRIQEIAISKGVLLNIANNNVIRLVPPLIITKRQLNMFLHKFRDILKEYQETFIV